jgi:hypothetical protein
MPSSTYEGRRAAGDPFELAVQDELWLRGWYTEPIGRGQLSAVMNEKINQMVRKTGNNKIAHVPDLLTVAADRTRAYIINAKADGLDDKSGTPKWVKTGNHCVQTDSLHGMTAAATAWGLPGVLVFDDWTYATVETITESCEEGRRPGEWRTKFVTFPVHIGKPFDELFGTVDGWSRVHENR